MKRTIVAAVAGVLSIGLALAGISTASAIGQPGTSDGPTPYSVDANGITLPSGTTFEANGDANINYTQYGQSLSKGIHFDPNNSQPGGAWIGKTNIPWSGFGLSGNFCVTWVQLSLYNEHYGAGGQAPFCVTGTPKDADATLTITPATCTSPETVSLGTLTNAKWGTLTNGVGPGTYSVVATATTNHLFSDGKDTKSFSALLKDKDTTLCSSPSCISNPDFTYTYNGTNAGVVTVNKSGVKSGTLCSPLYIRAAAWTFDNPVNGGTPSWAQTLFGYNDVKVTTLGDTAYAAPVVAKCKQYDIYASFTGFDALQLPTKLNGSHDPYEPAFLHETLNNNRGPNPTYYTDSSVGCDVVNPVATLVAGQCYWDGGQHASFKTVTFVYDNSLSNVPVVFTVQDNKPQMDYSAYTRTVAPHSIVYASAQASWTGGVGYTVLAGGKSFLVTVGSYDPCPPTVAACTTTTTAPVSTNLNPNGWTYGETRTLGSNTYVAGGLSIETHDNTDAKVGNGSPDQRKAAGYHATSVPLGAIGVPSIDYTSTSGALPGINLTIDKDGDGGFDGNLVYEPTLFGVGNWWASHDLGVVSSQKIPNPSYQFSFGTLNDFLAAWPNAKITAVGYSLGSGAVGAGVIHSITAGCVKYPFDYATVDAGTPAPVTFSDVCGVSQDQVNVPILTGAEHYTYSTVDNRVAGVGLVTVTAVPKSGFSFPTTYSWSYTFKSDPDNKCVKLGADPVATNQVCDLNTNGGLIEGKISVTTVANVTYTIHKTDAPSVADVTISSGSATVVPGHYTVTANVPAGYTINSSPSSWNYVVAANTISCQQTTLVAYDPEVTVGTPVCTASGLESGYLSIDASDPLKYFIGGSQLAAGRTNMAAGTYTVTAVAPPGDGVTGTNPFTVTIAAVAATTCSLTTLAFTGAGGTTLYLLIAAGLLMAGALVMMLRRPRRSPRHAA